MIDQNYTTKKEMLDHIQVLLMEQVVKSEAATVKAKADYNNAWEVAVKVDTDNAWEVAVKALMDAIKTETDAVKAWATIVKAKTEYVEGN